MKIWAIPSIMLDDGRLLRLHQSIHGALHELLKRPTKRTTNRFYRHAGYLVLRHWEAVNEMRMRGMNHASPVDVIWKQIPASRGKIRYKYTRAETLRDIALLRKKQHGAARASGTCGRVLAEGVPEDLNVLAEKHALEGLPKDVFLI